MRILLDECIDRRFARELTGLEVSTVFQMGWSGIKNGELMKLAETEFDVFITVDRNLSYQQNLPRFDIAIIVLKARSNRYVDLIRFGPLVRESLKDARKGQALVIS